MIHADYNDQNILVQERPEVEQTPVDRFRVTGVIDLGDAHEACVVMDVAIAIMYMMVDNKFMDPLDVGGHILFGYFKHRTLNDAEFDALKLLVAARFSQSLVMGAYCYSKDPGNEYLLMTAKQGWTVLDALWRKDKGELYSHWRDIMRQHKES